MPAAELRVRVWGTGGPRVLLLHGGPAAAGTLGSLARELADAFRVIEPFQRESGPEPLNVARHIADLQEVIERECGDGPPLVVGHSWGAMLALAHAAVHPDATAAIFLIGSGTFDLASRARMKEIMAARGTQSDHSCHLIDSPPDPEARFDAQAHRETWDDMLRLQAAGVYPATFAAIAVPVTMLHGADDPHPGPMIRDNLRGVLPQLGYVEWSDCGHYPWLERAARADFLQTLRRMLHEAGEASAPRSIRADR